MISDLGRTIRFDVEQSTNCGGANSAVQTGEAVATLVVPPGAQLAYTLQGVGELQDSGFENLRFFIDGGIVASSTSAGGSLGCDDGPVVVTTTQVSPVAVSGSIELKLEFTTTDGLFHEESFYELSFSFICPTEGPYSYSYTYKETPTAAPTTETGSPTSL